MLNVDAQGKEEGIWYLAHLEQEYRQGTASSNEDRRSVHPEHYSIETAIGGNARLASVADLTFTPVIDGERLIKFGLLPSLRVTRVSSEGKEITAGSPNRFSRNGSTASGLSGPPRLKRTTARFTWRSAPVSPIHAHARSVLWAEFHARD